VFFSALLGINKATGTGSDVLRSGPGTVTDGLTLQPDNVARRENENKAISVLRNNKIKSIMDVSPLGALCPAYGEIIKLK
jgi:hypothetical protein